MDIVLLNNGSTWILQALTESGGRFLEFDYPTETESEYPAEEARELCQQASRAGLNVGSGF